MYKIDNSVYLRNDVFFKDRLAITMALSVLFNKEDPVKSTTGWFIKEILPQTFSSNENRRYVIECIDYMIACNTRLDGSVVVEKLNSALSNIQKAITPTFQIT